jgi:hypothetical protein
MAVAVNTNASAQKTVEPHNISAHVEKQKTKKQLVGVQ